MNLAIEEAKGLNEALLSAYTYDSLERMLFFELGKQLEHIAPRDNLQQVIFKVITTAEKDGWTNDLVHAAHDANPGNVKMKRFVGQYLRFLGAKPTLEKIIQKTNGFIDVAAWRAKLERIERQVCSLEIAGDHAGTGFLIGHDLVMTNYHVIEDLLGAVPKFQPQQVRIRFDFKKSDDGAVLNDGVRYGLADGSWLVDASPYSAAEGANDFNQLPAPDELDFAVLRIAPHKKGGNNGTTPGHEPIMGSRDKTRGWIIFPKQPASFSPGMPLFIVQHPKKEPMKMALATDSIIGLNGNGTRVRHKTNTEEGSSGSACFDSNWELVALHHAGDPNWLQPQWNQAVPVHAIYDHWLRTNKLPLILGEAPLQPAVTDANTAAFSVDDEVDDLLQG
jgi:hypothetical protein